MTIVVRASDKGTIGRMVTHDGYVIAAHSILARTGIQVYRASDFSLHKVMSIAPDAVIRLYRPDEEVFDAESLASFNHVPLTLDHPSEAIVSADNWSQIAKGEVCDVVRDHDYVSGTVIIKSRDAIEAVDNGMVELSAGYRFELDLTPGVTPDGQPYDGVQRHIRGNHVAIVNKARCGSACRIGDSQKGDSMDKKVNVKGIVIEVGDTAASVIEQLAASEKSAQDALTAANAKLETIAKDHETVVAAKDAEIAELKGKIVSAEAMDAMVEDRAKTVTVAKRLMPTISTDKKTCADIHREVLAHAIKENDTAKAVVVAIVGDSADALNTASPTIVKSAFQAVGASATGETVANDGDRALADALAGKREGAPKLVGRDAMLARQHWKPEANK